MDEAETFASSLPSLSREYFSLGRLAMLITESCQVIALGGGEIACAEATASLSHGICWTVFALARGVKEHSPSLCDFAYKHSDNSCITLVLGKDPKESDVFAQVSDAEL